MAGPTPKAPIQKATGPVTVYETPLAKIVATPESWGLVVVFFGNFEVTEVKTARDIIDWFCGIQEKYVAFDLRNTLSIDDGALGLVMLLKGLSLEREVNVAVLCANNAANKINIAFKGASVDGSLKIYHSLHTFALTAASGGKPG